MAKRRFRSRGRFSRVRRRRGGPRRLKKFVKRVISRMSEVKWAIFGSTAVFDAATGSSVVVTPSINQGVDKLGTRIGNRVRYKFLQLRWIGALSDGSAPGDASLCTVRIILWQPRLTIDNTVAPTNLPIFGQSGLWAICSPINNQNCRILMDKTRALGVAPNSDFVNLPVALVLKKKVRVNNNVNYLTANNGAPQDPKDNYILTVITDQSNANVVNIGYRLVVRLSYIDI